MRANHLLTGDPAEKDFSRLFLSWRSAARALLSLVLMLAAGLFFICPRVVFADGCAQDWQPAGQYWSPRIIFANGRYWGVDGPSVVTSLDGIYWETAYEAPQSSSAMFGGIANYGEDYVVVGGSGAVLTSHGGHVWNLLAPVSSTNLSGITRGSAGWVAVGDGATALVSPDAVSWQAIQLPQDAYFLEAVTFADGLYVAVGNVIAVSTDGVSWNVEQQFPSGLWDVACGAGVFVAVGNTETPLISPDGLTWTQAAGNVDQSSWLFGVCYNGCQFVAVGAQGIFAVSPDGLTWTAYNTGLWESMFDVAFGNGRFVIVGDAGAFISRDGIHWNGHETANLIINAATFALGRHWAAGLDPTGDRPGAIASSQDGLTWDVEYIQQIVPSGIAFGTAGFVVVGSRNWTSDPMILTSPDGDSWTEVSAPTSDCSLAVCFAQGKYVAVGQNGLIMTSLDGLTWTLVSSGTSEALQGIIYAAGRFVAVGTNGVVLTSPNALAWSAGSVGTGAALSGVAYGAGKYVAVGAPEPGAAWQAIFTSPDGATWTAPDAYDPNYGDYTAVIYADGQFVVAGDWNGVMTSPDGASWDWYSSGTDSPMHALSYGNGFFALEGEGSPAVSQCQLHTYAAAGAVSGPVPLGVSFEAAVGGGSAPYSYSWDFGDGATATGISPSHTYTSPGQYTVSLITREAMYQTAVDNHVQITAGPPCQVLSCAATVVSRTATGVVVPFTSALQLNDCTCVPSCVWDYGDGTAPGSGAVKRHAYAAAGTYTWSLDATMGSTECQQSGSITVDAAPSISKVTKLLVPTRLKLLGSNFHESCVIKINGVAAPKTTYKGPTKVIAGGHGLSQMLPEGQPVQITVENPDDGGVSASYTFTP